MTLPMLAKNYQFYIRQQQFKKAYAALSVAVQKTQIDLGEGVKCFFLNGTLSHNNRTDCAMFFDELTKNLNMAQVCYEDAVIKGCLSSSYNGESVYAETQGDTDIDAAKDYFNYECSGFSSEYLSRKATVYVSNSEFILVPYTWYSGNQWQNENLPMWGSPLFLLDVNGVKGPNRWGYDVMVFQFDKRKQYDSVFSIVPSTVCHPIDVGGYYTRDFFNYLYGQNAEL